MSLNPSTFRRAAIGISTAAAMGVLALGSFPAAAQQANNGYNGSPACAPFKGTDRAIKCEIEQADLRIKESKLRTEESKLRANQLMTSTECIKYLTEGVKSGALVKSEIVAKADGKLSETNACGVARQFGFGRKAETGAPKLN